MKIVMINQVFGPTFSGRAFQMKRLAEVLVDSGAEVRIVTDSLSGSSSRQMSPERRYSIHRIGLEERANAFATWWDRRHLIRLIRELEPDVLQVFGRPSGVEAVFATFRLTDIATVFAPTLLDSDDLQTIKQDGRLGWLRYLGYRTADQFVAICPAFERRFYDCGIPAERVRHIPNGVDTDRFHPPEDRNREADRLDLDPSRPRALFVGSVVRRKGIDVILRAWSRVLKSVPGACLYLVGPLSGRTLPENENFVRECRALVEKYSMGASVSFLGRKDDMPTFYQAANVLMFASRTEGFPNVILEAMASGLPVVTTRIPGSTDESVDDGVTGFVVPQEDPKALADRTVRLLGDRTLREEFGEAARSRAVSRYSFEIVGSEYRSTYRDLSEM